MEEYNFWKDFFDTYQSLPDWLKAIWAIAPFSFILGIIALIMRHRIAFKKVEKQISGDLVYTIHRDEIDQLHIYQHGKQIGKEPAVLLLEQNITDPVEQQNPNSKR